MFIVNDICFNGTRLKLVTPIQTDTIAETRYSSALRTVLSTLIISTQITLPNCFFPASEEALFWKVLIFRSLDLFR